MIDHERFILDGGVWDIALAGYLMAETWREERLARLRWAMAIFWGKSLIA